jgi:hypothetical protein
MTASIPTPAGSARSSISVITPTPAGSARSSMSGPSATPVAPSGTTPSTSARSSMSGPSATGVAPSGTTPPTSARSSMSGPSAIGPTPLTPRSAFLASTGGLSPTTPLYDWTQEDDEVFKDSGGPNALKPNYFVNKRFLYSVASIILPNKYDEISKMNRSKIKQLIKHKVETDKTAADKWSKFIQLIENGSLKAKWDMMSRTEQNGTRNLYKEIRELIQNIPSGTTVPLTTATSTSSTTAPSVGLVASSTPIIAP